MSDCRICGSNEEEHLDLERRGIVNHQFSRDGELKTLEKIKPVSSRPRHEVLVVPGIDLPLRTLLIQKGILSEADFDDAGTIPGFAGTHRAPGASPSTEGSLRTPPEHPSAADEGPAQA